MIYNYFFLIVVSIFILRNEANADSENEIYLVYKIKDSQAEGIDPHLFTDKVPTFIVEPSSTLLNQEEKYIKQWSSKEKNGNGMDSKGFFEGFMDLDQQLSQDIDAASSESNAKFKSRKKKSAKKKKYRRPNMLKGLSSKNNASLKKSKKKSVKKRNYRKPNFLKGSSSKNNASLKRSKKKSARKNNYRRPNFLRGSSSKKNASLKRSKKKSAKKRNYRRPNLFKGSSSKNIASFKGSNKISANKKNYRKPNSRMDKVARLRGKMIRSGSKNNVKTKKSRKKLEKELELAIQKLKKGSSSGVSTKNKSTLNDLKYKLAKLRLERNRTGSKIDTKPSKKNLLKKLSLAKRTFKEDSNRLRGNIAGAASRSSKTTRSDKKELFKKLDQLGPSIMRGLTILRQGSEKKYGRRSNMNDMKDMLAELREEMFQVSSKIKTEGGKSDKNLQNILRLAIHKFEDIIDSEENNVEVTSRSSQPAKKELDKQILFKALLGLGQKLKAPASVSTRSSNTSHQKKWNLVSNYFEEGKHNSSLDEKGLSITVIANYGDTNLPGGSKVVKKHVLDDILQAIKMTKQRLALEENDKREKSEPLKHPLASQETVAYTNLRRGLDPAKSLAEPTLELSPNGSSVEVVSQELSKDEEKKNRKAKRKEKKKARKEARKARKEARKEARKAKKEAKKKAKEEAQKSEESAETVTDTNLRRGLDPVSPLAEPTLELSPNESSVEVASQELSKDEKKKKRKAKRKEKKKARKEARKARKEARKEARKAKKEAKKKAKEESKKSEESAETVTDTSLRRGLDPVTPLAEPTLELSPNESSVEVASPELSKDEKKKNRKAKRKEKKKAKKEARKAKKEARKAKKEAKKAKKEAKKKAKKKAKEKAKKSEESAEGEEIEESQERQKRICEVIDCKVDSTQIEVDPTNKEGNETVDHANVSKSPEEPQIGDSSAESKTNALQQSPVEPDNKEQLQSAELTVEKEETGMMPEDERDKQLAEILAKHGRDKVVNPGNEAVLVPKTTTTIS